VAGISFALISTLFAAVYMASSVAASLRERDARLEDMNRLLVEKDSIKSEYVYRVTHDIKGHLAAISGCLDPVMSGITGDLNGSQYNLIRRASRRTRVLLNFVRALLDLTRMRLSSQMDVEEIDVGGLVQNAMSYVQARAEERGISVSSEESGPSGTIRGARVYLEETIANLLANAVKYSNPGGKVVVSAEDRGESVVIRIRDEGIGIPRDELDKVFDEFYRATNARQVERDGTGLGLSMARQVVERHGGSIGVESEEGRGTTVEVSLPRVPETTVTQSGEDAGEHRDSARARVRGGDGVGTNLTPRTEE
jgi:signal transduction histidine kinase